MRLSEKSLAALFTIAGVAVTYLAWRTTDSFWQSYAAGVATTLLGFALGLFVVNHLLNRDAKRAAVGSLLQFITPSVGEAHNDILDEVYKKFSRSEFSALMERYGKSGGDPKALSPDERKKVYEVAHSLRDIHSQRLTRLAEDLKELALMLGWSFDPSVVESIYLCRFSMYQLQHCAYDGTPADLERVCEHLLDTDMYFTTVFEELRRLGSLSEDDVYSERRE